MFFIRNTHVGRPLHFRSKFYLWTKTIDFCWPRVSLRLNFELDFSWEFSLAKYPLVRLFQLFIFGCKMLFQEKSSDVLCSRNFNSSRFSNLLLESGVRKVIKILKNLWYPWGSILQECWILIGILSNVCTGTNLDWDWDTFEDLWL